MQGQTKFYKAIIFLTFLPSKSLEISVQMMNKKLQAETDTMKRKL